MTDDGPDLADVPDLPGVLARIAADVAPLAAEGEVADYIPALARVPVDEFALVVAPLDGAPVSVGSATKAFSIQSISKIFTLAMAVQRVGVAVWDRVGVEPSGDPFNSLVQLEHESGIPRNPFINSGAIVVADILTSTVDDPVSELVEFVSELAGAQIMVDGEVQLSESETGWRNRALANLMKGFDNIHGDPADVLEIYFAQCALSMSAHQLARALRFLANDGVDPGSGTRVLPVERARRINALMLTCGTYDAAGEFAFRVGVPCKSGVGGGIVGIIPHHMTACVWSPPLDETGNSIAGRAAMEQLVTRTGLSVF